MLFNASEIMHFRYLETVSEQRWPGVYQD